MAPYWNWHSRDAIEAEHRRLTTKLLALGGHSATGVLEAQIESAQPLLKMQTFSGDSDSENTNFLT